MSDENPILNNPYFEPRLHYATNPLGELDYENVVLGRRPFRETNQAIPVQQRGQRHLLDLDNLPEATRGERIINRLRDEVKVWRESGYTNTTRVTRELLHFWFKNEERHFTQQLFSRSRKPLRRPFS